MKFIEIKYGLIEKESVTALIREKEQYPWNGETHYDLTIHLQGTTVCLKFDSETERNEEFNRITEKLKKED